MSFSGEMGKQTVAQSQGSKKKQLRIHLTHGRTSNYVEQKSQTQISTYCVIPFTRNSRTDKTNGCGWEDTGVLDYKGAPSEVTVMSCIFIWMLAMVVHVCQNAQNCKFKIWVFYSL